MLSGVPAHTLPFRNWIWKVKENKRMLLLVATAVVIQFVTFKFLYPFANLADESYVAIEAAHKNWAVGYLPVGYPMFLRLVSSFTSNDTILVFLQYLILQAAILYLLFSIKYLLVKGKWVIRIVIAISVLNPLLLQVCNLITADSLFAALMLIWFTHLMWLLHQTRLSSILWHSVCLLLLFMVNHNAWYCILISILVFLFLPIQRKIVVIGIAMIVVLFAGFIGGTQAEFKRRSGWVQFSAQWGWQKAANALYAYAHADTLDRKKVQGRFRELHGIVNEHMLGLNKFPAFVRPDRKPDDYYLMKENAPLKTYMREAWTSNDSSSAFKKWASMGPLYTQYGDFLIGEYLGLYWKYYLLPNLKNYYVPETEALSTYNRLRDTAGSEAVAFFQWKSNKITTVFKSKLLKVPYYSSIPLAVINLVFILGFIALSLAGGFSAISSYCKRLLLLLLFTWLANVIFSVWASPIVLRQQLFVMQLTLTFGVLFVAMLVQMSFSNNTGEGESAKTRLLPNPL
jgi:hypothetical protein